MFKQLGIDRETTTINVCGIPFGVSKNEKGVVEKLGDKPYAFGDSAEILYFLGMTSDSDFSSEWWSQNEVQYDHSIRVFLGDRLARIHVTYTDRTEDLISVIFGVNCWNYNLYFRPKPEEGLLCFEAPYQEPFLSDKHAKVLLDRSLKLTENKSEDAYKASKFVFAYRPDPAKTIKEIAITKEDGKRANVAISAITGSTGEAVPAEIGEEKVVDRDFFLGRKYYADLDRLMRRLYQFKDEIPAHDPKREIEGFDAPDITFTGTPEAEIFTNVYRYNIMDMAYKKLDDDGRSHTSTPGTANFSCYLGLGTYCTGRGSYGGHVWTRDVGRTLMEVVNAGYFDRAVKGAEYLEQLLYYPSVRFKIPHWKRVANLIARDENDLFNEGNENDGHASVMLFMYSLFRKGAVSREWLIEHKPHLVAAADYYFWQKEHPAESNFSDILYSHSEASTQIPGGYDLFSNLISSLALLGYSRLFDAIGDDAYARKCLEFSGELRRGAEKHFMLDHPRFGRVYTDTTDDCWTYEYKRMVDLLIYSDLFGYDLAAGDPKLFDLMSRTFDAEKEVYYAPCSARQMGYGQGYITQAAFMLDRFDELTACVEAAADMCYHHTDEPYIVPEGVIVHGSGRFWFRNSDLGNAVQQAETVKCARLIAGIDDICPEQGLRFVPRLPDGWQCVKVNGFSAAVAGGGHRKVDFYYGRIGGNDGIAAGAGCEEHGGVKCGKYVHCVSAVCKQNASAGSGYVACTAGTAASCESAGSGYVACWSGDVNVSSLRMGPFATPDITVTGGKLLSVKEISGRFFAYVVC